MSLNKISLSLSSHQTHFAICAFSVISDSNLQRNNVQHFFFTTSYQSAAFLPTKNNSPHKHNLKELKEVVFTKSANSSSGLLFPPLECYMNNLEDSSLQASFIWCNLFNLDLSTLLVEVWVLSADVTDPNSMTLLHPALESISIFRGF